jgi:hypothetical protein
VANALVLWNAKDPSAVKFLEELAQKRTEDPKTKAVSWAPAMS